MNPIQAVIIQTQSFGEHFNKVDKSLKLNRFFTFCDYLVCAARYGSSASDYFDFEFYNKRHNARKEFFCYKLKNKLFHKINDYGKKKIFDDKVTFLKTFSDFIGREWFDTRVGTAEEFSAFCDRHPAFIAKPAADGAGGRGVYKVDTRGADRSELYRQLRADGMLAEELIEQHPKLKEIYGGSVNTIRVATVTINGKMNILAAAFRCGSGGGCVDNYSSGGMAVKVEPETGILISDARNGRHDRFVRHPDSGVMFHGFQIPHWDMVKEMLEKTVRVVPGVGYTGWDVAVRENDVILVEGNFEGMIHIIQQPADCGIRAGVEALMAQIP